MFQINMNLDQRGKQSEESPKSSYGNETCDILIGLKNYLRSVDIKLDKTRKQSFQSLSSSVLQQLYNEWLGYIEYRTRYADLTEIEIDDISARFKLSPEVVLQALKFLREKDNIRQSLISDQEYDALCVTKTKDDLFIRLHNLRRRNRILLKNAVENAIKTPYDHQFFSRVQWTPVWQASHLCYEEVLQILDSELEKAKKDGDSYSFSADSEETYLVSYNHETIADIKSAVIKDSTGKNVDPLSIKGQSQKENNVKNTTIVNIGPNNITDQSQTGTNRKNDHQQSPSQVRGAKLGGQQTKVRATNVRRGSSDQSNETSKLDMVITGNAAKVHYLHHSRTSGAGKTSKASGRTAHIFTCEECSLNYLTETGYREHINKVHSQKKEIHQAEGPSYQKRKIETKSIFQRIPLLEKSFFSKTLNERMKNDAGELSVQPRAEDLIERRKSGAESVTRDDKSVRSDNVSLDRKNNVTTFTLISHDDASDITTETKSQTTKSPCGTMLINQTKSTSYKGTPRTNNASGTLDQIAKTNDDFSERNYGNTQVIGREFKENIEDDKREYKKRRYDSSGQPLLKDWNVDSSAKPGEKGQKGQVGAIRQTDLSSLYNLPERIPKRAHGESSQAGKSMPRSSEARQSVDGTTEFDGDSVSSGLFKGGLIHKHNRGSITTKFSIQGSSDDQFIRVPPGIKGLKLDKSMYPECSYDEKDSAFWNKYKTALDLPMGIIQIKQINEEDSLDLSINFFNCISVALRVKGYSAPSGEELRDDVIRYMESNGKALEFTKYFISYPQYFEFLAAVNQGTKAPSRTVINATGQFIHMEIVYYSHCSEVISEESFNINSLAKPVFGKIFLHEPLGEIVLVEAEDIPDCNLRPWKVFSTDVQYEGGIYNETIDNLRKIDIDILDIYTLYPECIFSHPDNYVVQKYLNADEDVLVVSVFPDSCCLFHAVSAALRYISVSFIHLGWAECPPGYHLRMQLAHFMKSKVLRNEAQSYYTLDVSQLENDKEPIATYLERVECLENGSLWPCDFELDAICDFLRINITMLKFTETGFSKTLHKYGGSEAPSTDANISIANVFNERCFVLFPELELSTNNENC